MSMDIERIDQQLTLDRTLLRWLSAYAVAGCVIFFLSIIIADFVVPNHDWIADTISDLGAGQYEFIVDTGIYAFSASLLSIALLCAHVHLGRASWSLGTVAIAFLALIVFLIGARNEYGDNDNEGFVIHIYLVYLLGALMTLIPLLMARGAAQVDPRYRCWLIGVAVVWAISAPFFFLLPTEFDGIYERYLGLISFVMVGVFAHLFRRIALGS